MAGMMEQIIHQLVCDASYGAAAVTGHVPPRAFSDHLIERLKHHVDELIKVQHRVPTDPRFADFLNILAEIKELHCRKSNDYGQGGDPYANIRASERFGVPAWVGSEIRCHDKVVRIQSFIANGTLTNESLEDSLLDKCVYSIISLMLYRQSKQV